MFGCGVEIGVGRRDRRWAWDVEIAVGHGDQRWALGVEIGTEIGLWVLFIYGASCSFMGLILLGFVLAVVG